MISGLGRGKYVVGDLVYMRDSTKKKGQSPKPPGTLERPLCDICQLCAQYFMRFRGLRQKRIMHHDRLKPYDCEVIPAGVRRQRSEILQKSKDTPDNPIMQEPLHEPEPPASQGSSETESIYSDQEPQKNQDKERKRQPAARRRRKKTWTWTDVRHRRTRDNSREHIKEEKFGSRARYNS